MKFRIITKMTFFLLLFVGMSTINAQNADPAITGAVFVPDSISVTETSELQISFSNAGFDPIPAMSIELTISTSDAFYTSDGTTAPGGAGGALFDWVYIQADIWRGTNNAEIPMFVGGEITLDVTGVAESSTYELSNINVQPIANFAAFANENTNNNNLQPGLLVTLGCPDPADDDLDGLTNCEETTGVDDLSTAAMPNGTSDPMNACDPDPSAVASGDCDMDGNPNGADPNPEEAVAEDDVASGVSTEAEVVNILDNDDFLPGQNTCINIITNETTAQGTITSDAAAGTLTYTGMVSEEGMTVEIGYEVCNKISPTDSVCAEAIIEFTVTDGCPNLTDSDVDGLTDCEEETGVNDPGTPATPNGISNPMDACDPNPAAVASGDCDMDGTPNGSDPNPDMVVVEDDDDSVFAGNTICTDIFANDDFVLGMNITFDTLSSTGNGTVTLDGMTGMICYESDTLDAGTIVLIEYEICNNGVNPSVCGTAFLRIMVNAGSTVSGIVFGDDTDFGQYNVGADSLLEGVSVYLYNDMDVLVADTITDADGEYLFANLEAGDYYVEFGTLGDYNVFTLDSVGAPATASYVVTQTAGTNVFSVNAVDDIENLNAGLVACGPISIQSPVNLSLSNDCVSEVTPGMLLTVQQFPDSLYEVVITGKTDNFFTSEDIGKSFTVVVTSELCNNEAWGTINVEYYGLPEIECGDTIFTSCHLQDSTFILPLGGVEIETPFVGSLDDTDPIWTRPFVAGGCFISGVGVDIPYETHSFSLDMDSDFGAEVVSFSAPGGDSYLCLYEENFDPTDQCTNLVITNDDGGVGLLSQFDVMLNSGVTYTLVVTTWNNDGNDYGDYEVEITSDATLVTPSPITSCDTANIDLVLVSKKDTTYMCDTMYSGASIREYKYVDSHGNESNTCTQVIMFEKTNLDSISFPIDRTLANLNPIDCSILNASNTTPEGYPKPSVSGGPILTLNGEQIELDGIGSAICNGYVQYYDELLYSNNCKDVIMRTFYVGEWFCNDVNEIIGFQRIEVKDLDGPTFPAQPDRTVGTDPFSCSATVTLPIPNVTDMCSPDGIRIELGTPLQDTIVIEEGQQTVDVMFSLGTSQVYYNVYDGCGNVTTDTVNVTVVDDTDPIAICDQITKINLAIDFGELSATSVDDGSFDECGDVTIAIAKVDNDGNPITPFGPKVDVGCTDAANGGFMVALLVTDEVGNDNLCMAWVEVVGQTPSIFCNQTPTTVNCDYDYVTDPANYFQPTLIDNQCPGFSSDSEYIDNRNGCGVGNVILRTYLLDGNNNQIDYCDQVLAYVGTVTPITLNCPADTILDVPEAVTELNQITNLPDLGLYDVVDPASINDCQNLGISSKLEIYAQEPGTGVILKVRRVVKIVDWCQDNGLGSVLNPYVCYQILELSVVPGSGMRVTVGGRLYTETDEQLSEVDVELASFESIISATDDNGQYAFPDMPMGGDYTVTPYNNEDVLNGVSTLDLVLIQRHILEIKAIESPYKLIAADINNSERLTAADLTSLRKVILGVTMDFPNNTSWRFVDEAFTFEDETDPWTNTIPEDYEIEDLSEDMNIDFIAIKTGDINGNVDLGNFSNKVSNTRSDKTFYMEIPNIEVEKGNDYSIEIVATEGYDLRGLQFELNTNGIQIKDIMPQAININRSDIALSNGNMKVSYANAIGSNIKAGEVMYTLAITAHESGDISDMVSIFDKSLASEAYLTPALETGNIEISWREEATAIPVAELALGAVIPNPWRSSTEITFDIPRAGNVALKITDANGRLLFTKQDKFSQGKQSITISDDEIDVTGILIYELKYEDQILNNRMIKIK